MSDNVGDSLSVCPSVFGLDQEATSTGLNGSLPCPISSPQWRGEWATREQQSGGSFPENSRGAHRSSKLLIYNIHTHTVCKKKCLRHFNHLQPGVAVEWHGVGALLLSTVF